MMIFDYLTSMTPNMNPPYLIDLMQSLVNFGKEEKTKISNISEKAVDKIFNFDYPLTPKVNKKTFEKSILNHFIMRRIGYETFTAWHIALETKLNEIMPDYNILFNAINDWDLFNDGESEERISTDNRNVIQTENSDSTSNNSIDTTTTNNSNTDNRNSKMPQNNIQNVKDGRYLSDYSYNQINSNDNSKSVGTSSNNTNSNKETNDNNNFNETIKKSTSNKIQAYNDFISNRNHIMTMIYDELEILFFGLI